MFSEDYIMIGEGARHWVVTSPSSPYLVYRIDKNLPLNNREECEKKLRYHKEIVDSIFASLIPRQRITTISSPTLTVMETDNLLRGEICVEIKPKWREFVVIQKFIRKYKHVYYCDKLWSTEFVEVMDGLNSAMDCDKPYLKIHRGLDVDGTGRERVLKLVASALLSSQGRDLMKKIDHLSSWACEDRIRPIAKLLDHIVPLDMYTHEIMFPQSLDEMVKVGKSLVESQDVFLSLKWINTYLTGRMARDVSIMFSFSETAETLGDPIVRVSDNMFCRIAVVDTDLKPRCKIHD